MNRIVCLFLLLTIGTCSFGQLEQIKPSVNTDYLQKSKRQKTTAWVLLSASGACIITSMVIPKGDFVGYTPDLREEYSNDGVGASIFVAGVAAGLASIPFFIAANKNKKRAANVSAFIKMERSTTLQNASLINRSYPALTLRLNL